MQKLLIFDNELSTVVLDLQKKLGMSYAETLMGLKLTENRILNMQNTTAAYEVMEQSAAANSTSIEPENDGEYYSRTAGKESEEQNNEIENANK